MAKQGAVIKYKSARPPTSLRVRSTHADGDGNHVHNEILLALPPEERKIVFSELEFLRLKSHQLLQEAGDTIKSAYFCNTGLISILSVFPDGTSVEVGLVGKQGFVGLPLLAGFRTAATRAVVQVDATIFRMDARILPTILSRCPTLADKLQQFSQIMAIEVTQIAACNRLHEVEERLARWLLMSADRVDSVSLPLTQDLLAQMLGTRRSSVTIAAGALHRAGLIAYRRGNINIVDRARLEKAACDCYSMMRRQTQKWLSEQPGA